MRINDFRVLALASTQILENPRYERSEIQAPKLPLHRLLHFEIFGTNFCRVTQEFVLVRGNKPERKWANLRSFY